MKIQATERHVQGTEKIGNTAVMKDGMHTKRCGVCRSIVTCGKSPEIDTVNVTNLR